MDETYYKFIKWFGLGFLIWIFISVIAMTLYIFLDYDWLGIFLNTSAPLINLFSMLFCIYTWIKYRKISFEQEKEFNEHIDYYNSVCEKIEIKPKPIISISFKARRRNMAIMYSIAILLNLSALIYNINRFI